MRLQWQRPLVDLPLDRTVRRLALQSCIDFSSILSSQVGETALRCESEAVVEKLIFLPSCEFYDESQAEEKRNHRCSSHQGGSVIRRGNQLRMYGTGLACIERGVSAVQEASRLPCPMADTSVV